MSASLRLSEETSRYQTIDPPCPYVGTCGGCALQDFAYRDQLAIKRERVQRALAALPHVPAIELVELEDPWRYRNKAELTFSESDGRLILGYHAARAFWRVIDLEDCLLLPQAAMRVVREVRDLAAGTSLAAYHPRAHQGFFRHLIVRHSRATGRVLICLVTAPGSREVIEQLAEQLMARQPAVCSVYWGVTGRPADAAIPEALWRVKGAEYLEDQLGPFRLQLHPLSFLQTNTVQADRLYRRMCEVLQGGSNRVAWDLYCGIGLVGLYLSSRMGRVYGIDCEPHHLALAQRNAAANDVSNLEFRMGEVETLLTDRRFWLQEGKPDVVVVDPPRAGLHPRALNSLLAARPAQIVYLSCNVHTLVRDLQRLLAGFPPYRLTTVQAFDMFPHTNHVELLVYLERGISGTSRA